MAEDVIASYPAAAQVKPKGGCQSFVLVLVLVLVLVFVFIFILILILILILIAFGLAPGGEREDD